MLTWAMPVTVMLTPWEVYTAVLVTVRVIVFRDILQPPTRYTLILHSILCATFLAIRFTIYINTVVIL